VKGVPGRYIAALPTGGFYVSGNGRKPADTGSIWFVKDGKRKLVGSGLKLSAGLAYRPDGWLLSVADGASKWVYSYQMNPDGMLSNCEQYYWLHVRDWEDDAGTGSICFALEGRQFSATRFGVQISADDGPTQVILPVPDRSRVLGVCLGGRHMDTLYAFCAGRIWKRRVKVHAMGAFSPWVGVGGTGL
jgi:sugar lactone lactonase YvrE